MEEKKIKKIIVDALDKNNKHLTVLELFDLVKGEIGVKDKKIYKRMLDRLEKDKKIVSIITTGNAKRYDSEKEHHFHFICDSCGTVKNINIENSVMNMFKNHAQLILNSFAKIDRVNMSFQGICHDCRNNKKNKKLY